MLHAMSLGAALAVLWILLSGMFEPLLIGLGVASIVLTIWIARHMDVVDHEAHPVHFGIRALLYYPWLTKEIIIANIDVAKVILSPKMKIQPHVFTVKASQLSDIGRTTYANSITLTPGTVTIAMTEGRDVVEVHALTGAARAGVESNEMNRRCTAMEGMTQKDVESDAKARAELEKKP